MQTTSFTFIISECLMLNDETNKEIITPFYSKWKSRKTLSLRRRKSCKAVRSCLLLKPSAHTKKSAWVSNPAYLCYIPQMQLYPFALKSGMMECIKQDRITFEQASANRDSTHQCLQSNWYPPSIRLSSHSLP